MYRMYGRNVSSCRNVNLYEKGYGSQIQKELIEFQSGYAWITGLFFPYTLFLIWVWLFEKKKVWRKDRFMFKISSNQAPTLHWFLERGLPWHETGICR